MTKDEALQMCLEYIETDAHERRHVRWAIKDALAQPEQEPVAWKLPDKNVVFWEDTKEVDEFHGFEPTIPLYTTPPQPERPAPCTKHCEATAFQITIKNLEAQLAQRKPLTDEDIKKLWVSNRASLPRYLCFARAIEAKLKEKNT